MVATKLVKSEKGKKKDKIQDKYGGVKKNSGEKNMLLIKKLIINK